MQSQTTTRNMSFIKQWRRLQDEDIENNIFMLQVNNDNLDLGAYPQENKKYATPSYREIIQDECKENIWYAMREAFVIPSQMDLEYGNFDASQHLFLTKESLWLLYGYDKRISTSIVQDTTHDDTLKKLIYLMWLYTIAFKYTHNTNYNKNIHTIPILIDTTTFADNLSSSIELLNMGNMEMLGKMYDEPYLTSHKITLNMDTDNKTMDHLNIQTAIHQIINHIFKKATYIPHDTSYTDTCHVTFFINRDLDNEEIAQYHESFSYGTTYYTYAIEAAHVLHYKYPKTFTIIENVSAKDPTTAILEKSKYSIADAIAYETVSEKYFLGPTAYSKRKENPKILTNYPYLQNLLEK